MALPKNYVFLNKEGAPKMLVEALALFGTKETVGEGDNPTILKWAKETGVSWYKHDSTPWCGLFAGLVAQRAGKEKPKDFLRAMAWQNFGKPAKVAMLGDILVFKRDGGGHVGIYVGDDDVAYHVLGGNQSDQVCIKRIRKDRCVAIRRPEYSVGKPKNVRRIVMKPNGELSTNEA